MRATYFTSESVTEGHPDKVADRISDAVLDAVISEDPYGRVACETLVTTDLVVVAGEITTTAQPDIEKIARSAIRDIGYTDPDTGFSADNCEVNVVVGRQSPDISAGVSKSLEARLGSEDPLDALGAGDQGLMFGYAVDQSAELMPLPIQLAHRLAEQLSRVRKEGIVGYLRPDGKTQVMVQYAGERPVRVSRVLISTQHAPDMDDRSRLEADLRLNVLEQVIDPALMDDDTAFLVNPSGNFKIGGPEADTGLTGRKIIVDTYGGYARHGGGAFSGKDPTKVDRSAAYAARHVAKNVVAAGLASRCEMQIAYAIGQAHPFSIHVETFGTSAIDPVHLDDLVAEFFDLRPGAIIERLQLRRPIYAATTAYGHFGRDLPEFLWESTDRAEDLAAAARDL